MFSGAEAYDRFMGRYSEPLAPELSDFAGVTAGQRVLDVGCGPGALTAELVRRVGPARVTAVDPSEPFVAAARARHEGVDVRWASAETLPFDDGEFDVVLAQLVVHFMADPVGGLREMARVSRRDGAVAACVWDMASGEGPLGLFWEAARDLNPAVVGESHLPGARQGHLAMLLGDAGLDDVEEAVLSVRVEHESFDDWWEPFTLGIGPAGTYVAQLDREQRIRLRERCSERFAATGRTLTARAWAARGRARYPAPGERRRS